MPAPELPGVTTTGGGATTVGGETTTAGGVTTGAVTFRSAVALVTEPAELATTTLNVPASANATLEKASVLFVAPATATPFFIHWKPGAGVPVA